jgi:hypothetical protein
MQAEHVTGDKLQPDDVIWLNSRTCQVLEVRHLAACQTFVERYRVRVSRLFPLPGDKTEFTEERSKYMRFSRETGPLREIDRV